MNALSIELMVSLDCDQLLANLPTIRMPRAATEAPIIRVLPLFCQNFLPSRATL